MSGEVTTGAQQAHQMLVEAHAAISGLRNLTVDVPDEGLSFLKPFELDMLLKPIQQTIDDARKAIE